MSWVKSSPRDDFNHNIHNFISRLLYKFCPGIHKRQERYKTMYIMRKILPRAYKQPPRPFYETLGFAVHKQVSKLLIFPSGTILPMIYQYNIALRGHLQRVSGMDYGASIGERLLFSREVNQWRLLLEFYKGRLLLERRFLQGVP